MFQLRFQRMTKGLETTKAPGLIVFLVLLSAHILTAQYDSFSFDGYDRTYLLHLPEGYHGQEALPLVIAMHGGTGSALNLQNQSRLSVKADEENFAVVYPEGVQGGILNARTWNAGWCCGFASNTEVDDVGFINALLDTLMAKYQIDTSRVYATGMSNGGFMSYRLACELSDRIAAIAPVAASMSLSDCNPTRPIPIIHFHSYQDSSVPYLGGVGDGISNHHNTAQDSVLNAWSDMNGCHPQLDTVENTEQFLFTTRAGCDCGAEIQRYLTADGGHSWPGGNQTLIGDPTSTVIDANDLMWTFFSRYSLECSKVTSTRTSQYDEIKIFPNPTRDRVQVEGMQGAHTVSVYDQLGRLVLIQETMGSVDLTSLRPGTYILRFRSDTNLAVRMISKLN